MADATAADRALVQALEFKDEAGWYRFAPRPDITPFEAILLTQLFIKMTLGRGKLDWREYLNRRWSVGEGQVYSGLMRHFQEVG